MDRGLQHYLCFPLCTPTEPHPLYPLLQQLSSLHNIKDKHLNSLPSDAVIGELLELSTESMP